MTEDVVSLCDADFINRRQRAGNLANAALVEDLGHGMSRRIIIIPGYDHREFGCGHGQHGMEQSFLLTGPKGAIGWTYSMLNMVPGNIDTINCVHPIESNLSVVPVRYPHLHDAMGVAVDIHAVKQHFDEQTPIVCKFVQTGECYSDVSYVAGGEILAKFIDHGPMAVWAELSQWYKEYFA